MWQDGGSSRGRDAFVWRPLASGLGLCGLIAAGAWIAGFFLPLAGAPVLAIGSGVALANLLDSPDLAARIRLKEISNYGLRAGIVGLGLTLDLGQVARTGLSSLAVLAVTIVAGLVFALGIGRALGVRWRTRCLIGIGTTICGASAIAALAPVLRARGEEIAYSVSVIFLYNMLAVILFPGIGHTLGLSDHGFGLWAGTAINDTSAVVAAGFAFSKAAGTYATVVKLTRTVLIIPLVLGFSLALLWLDRSDTAVAGRQHLATRLSRAVPGFILLFVLATVANTLGAVGTAAPLIQLVARYVLILALAAVGLQARWRVFAGAGLPPLLLGLGTWAVVALASLAVQGWTAQL